MPRKSTIRAARRDAREGKAPTTQAGEFVREEIEHVREGKHGARSAKQAIAIGLSKARRSGVRLPPPRKGSASDATRRKASQDTAKAPRRAMRKPAAPSRRRSRATTGALKREGTAAASPRALSRQAKTAAARRRRASGSARPAKRRAPTRRQAEAR
jgi:hypothetical protein